MRCAGCKQENREGRKFCAACGSPLAVACGKCGAPNEPGERFCGECGSALDGAADDLSPRTYSPKHLADKILGSRSALEGAREPAAAALANAAVLIDRTGARTLAPALCEWRAELAAVLGDEVTRAQLLREAHRLYEQIGAPLQAARIARELDA